MKKNTKNIIHIIKYFHTETLVIIELESQHITFVLSEVPK